LPAFEPKQLKPIPNSVPADVKILLLKYPAILRTWGVKPTPTHGVEHHSHPQFLKNSATLIQKNLRLPRRNSKGWSPLALFIVPNRHGHHLCTWCPKQMDHGSLVAITAI
jgi:histone acetyltransferase (RNA polymerase elongator complex component)